MVFFFAFMEKYPEYMNRSKSSSYFGNRPACATFITVIKNGVFRIELSFFLNSSSHSFVTRLVNWGLFIKESYISRYVSLYSPPGWWTRTAFSTTALHFFSTNVWNSLKAFDFFLYDSIISIAALDASSGVMTFVWELETSVMLLVSMFAAS